MLSSQDIVIINVLKKNICDWLQIKSRYIDLSDTMILTLIFSYNSFNIKIYAYDILDSNYDISRILTIRMTYSNIFSKVNISISNFEN